MKKTQIILILLAVSLLFSSCARRFSPMYYYNKKSNSIDSDTDAPTSDIEIDEDIPEDQDPFINGEWNDINYRFDGNKILEFLFGASFDGNNVPIYKFYKKDAKKWELKDTLTSEYYFNGSDDGNKAQSYNIDPANFYRYDYKNPLVDPAGSYNQSTRMQRFLFYRLQGKAVVVTLNNYLIAIDTHSKLVFAYAKITKTGEAVGQKYPTEFEAVELHGDKRPFYEYDPIGFVSYDEVKDTLTLTLYREYQEEMAINANAFFPKIHDSSRTLAGYKDRESAGLSPYYKVNIADINPEDILKNFTNKTYSIRSGLTLYTYKFSEDAKQVTIILEHFYDGKISEKTYDYTEVAGATSLKYGDITITGLESYAKVKDSVNNVAAELDYVDPGPEFIYRVRGKKYDAKDKSYSYKFNIDGKVLEYYENGKLNTTYIFSQQDASDRAVYQVKGGGSLSYRGFRLDNDGDIKDGVIYRGIKGDIPSLAPTAGVTDNPGYLNVDESITEFFVDAVANKTYSYRDYEGTPSDGRSLKKFSYQFSADGKTITYTEIIPKQEQTSVTYTLVEDKGKSAIYSLNGQQYTFTLQSSGEDLMKNDQPAGELNFYDRGAYFLDIVANTTYYAKDGSYKYVFDGSGNLTYTYPSGKTATYTVYGNTRTYYDKAAYTEDGALIFKYWALKVNTSGSMVQMSTGALADANHILNSAAYGYDAYLTHQGGVPVDRFMSSVAGQTYKMRNSNNSALMQYYTFSFAGNYITHVVTNTETGKQTSSNMYYNYQAVDKDVNGIYEEQFPVKQNKTFTLKNNYNELYLNGILVGYLNYVDTGLSFVDRVAGKTYRDKYGKYEYRFDSSGKVLEHYKNGELADTYNFSAEYKNDNKAEYTVNGSLYWGLRLADDGATKDGILYWSFGGSPIAGATSAITHYAGYLNAEVIVESFIDKLKNKTYKFRDYSGLNSKTATGKSLTLYSYSFNAAADTLTYKAETWKGSTVTVDYTFKEQTETDATYAAADGKTLKVTLQGNEDILYKVQDIARSVTTELGRISFEDKGPLFLDMVKGSTYIAQDNSYKYTFSENGATLTYTYPSGDTKTYQYSKIKSDAYNIAAYKQDDTVFPRYWGLKITEEGNKAEWSTGSLAFADDILNSAVYGADVAYLGDGPLVTDKFLNSVGRKVFEVRNTQDSTKLERYTFSSGGATLTYEQIDWYTDSVTKIVYDKYEKISDTKAKYSYIDNNGQVISAEFSIDSVSPTTLSKDSAVAGYYNYKDPGPNFVDRVKGKTYAGTKNGTPFSFKFNETAEKVEFYWNGSLYNTYTFADIDYDSDGNVIGSRAIYKQSFLTYWGFKLVDKDGKKDAVLYRTSTSWGGTSTTPAESANDYESYRVD